MGFESFFRRKAPVEKSPEQEQQDKNQARALTGAAAGVAILSGMAAVADSPEIPKQPLVKAESPAPQELGNTSGVVIDRTDKSNPTLTVEIPATPQAVEMHNNAPVHVQLEEERIPVALDEHRIQVDAVEH